MAQTRSEAVRVFIQRSSDRYFLKGENVWVQAMEEAQTFANCTPAIDYCVERKLEGVRLWLNFEDPKYDFPMEVFRAETKVLVKYNQEARAQQRQLMAALDNARAQTKKPLSLPRQALAENAPEPGLP